MKARNLVVIWIVIGLLLVGCSKPAPTPVPQPTAAATTGAPAGVSTPKPAATQPPAATAKPAAPAAAPTAAAKKPSGTLVAAAVAPSPEATMPDQSSTSGIWPISGGLVYESLFETNPDTLEDGIPWLATGYKIADDARTVTLDLRRGVQFHDGWGEMTAEDVKFSIEMVKGPKSLSTQASVWRERMTQIDIVNPYQVVIRMKMPYPEIIMDLSQLNTGLLIVSKKHVDSVGYEKAAEKPVGTAPFRMVEWKRGQSMKYVWFENYWGKAPDFAEILVKFVPEESTRIAMLVSGEADIIELPRELVKRVKDEGFKVVTTPVPTLAAYVVLGGQYLPTDPGYKADMPWLDKRVREAMNIAIDRQAIIDRIWMGYADPASNFLLSPKSIGYDPGWKAYPYDRERAKRLLADAGYANGFKVQMYSYTRPGVSEYPTIMQAIATYWDAVGIKSTIQPIEFANVRSLYREHKMAGSVYPTRAGIYRDASSRFTEFFHSKGNIPAAHSAEIDALINRLEATSDAKGREQLTRQLGDLIYNNYLSLPLAFVHGLVAINPKKVGQWKGTLAHGLDGLATATKP